MNIYPLTVWWKPKRLLTAFMVFFLLSYAPQNLKGQQILNNVIIGDDVACPGLTNEYHIGLDIYFPMNIQWRIIDGPGEFVGSDRGESVKIQWKTSDRGFTKLVMFAVSYYPPIGLIDTVTIHVDKDLNRMNLNCIQNLIIDFGMDCERYIDMNEVITNGKIKCMDDFDFSLELDNFTVPNPVPKRYIGNTFKATLTHKATGQFCRSEITLDDFSGPRLTCKNDTVLCSDPRAYDPKNNLFGKPKVQADCNENYTLKVNEYKWVNVENDPFLEGYIERVWRATDQNGNSRDCTDTVFLRKIVFNNIKCPEDTQISCESMEMLDQPLLTGTPTFDGQSIYSDDPYCKVYATYSDEEVPGCGGSKTIFRTWTISSYEDEVVKEKTCTQTIEVIDTTGPVIIFNEKDYIMEKHSDLKGAIPGKTYPTFYRNAITENCRAEGDFPIPELIQECGTHEGLLISIRWQEGQLTFKLGDPNADTRFRDMTIGTYLVEYSAFDDCNNMGRDTIVLVLRDKKPPTVILDDDPGVVLTGTESLTWGEVSSFDEGSFDNCELRMILARRVDWKTACGYTSDTGIESSVRDYYDEFAGRIALYEDSCLTNLVKYGWTNRIPFCCDDVCSDGVLVEFLAIDSWCNYSKLVTRVQVSDRSQPSVKYKLPDISMNCYTYQTLYKEEVDKGNMGVFGNYVTTYQDRNIHSLNVYECSDKGTTPYVNGTIEFTDGLITDNCNVAVEETFEENIGICGEGYLERIFTISNPCSKATDKSESIQVIQKIWITKDCRLRQEDFLLPYKDTTVINCTLTDVPARGPVLQRAENCKDIGIAYSDQVTKGIENTAGVCFTIKRTWEISDWCESDPYYLPEFVQYIYIKNTEGPTVENGKVDDICIGQGCDYSFSRTLRISDDCTPQEYLIINWRIEKMEPGSWETVKSGSGIQIRNISLKSGQYRLLVEMEDLCQNKTSVKSDFSVGFCQALKIQGPESITFNLNSSNDKLRLTDIPYEVMHPCPQAQYEVMLRYKGEGLIDDHGNVLPPVPGSVSLDVNCSKLGSNLIELWVVDDAGNSSFYVLNMDVKDPRGLCPNGGNQLSGNIKTPNLQPISNVSVRLNGPVTEIRRNYTDSKGQFNLGTFPATNEPLMIQPTKEDSPVNGITAFDALNILRMAIHKSTPATPYERIAADINEDGIISVLDVLMIQSLLLNRISQLPGRQWVFVNSEMKPISHIKANQEYRSMLHFTGVKKGDVNFSASIRSRDRKNLSREELVFGEPELFNGFIRIPVNMSSAETVKSMQFSLKNNNKTAWLAVEPGRLNIQLDDYTMDEHELSLVWIANGHQPDRLSKADFYLVFDNIHSEDVDREKIDLSLKLTPEIFNGQELKENIRLNTVHSAGTFEVSSAYPNPFAHTVRFNLTGTTGKLIVTEVYDLSGKQIYRQIIGQEVTEYTLDGSLLPAPGFYTIRFILDAGVVNRKLYYLP